MSPHKSHVRATEGGMNRIGVLQIYVEYNHIHAELQELLR
jgi:hypothetical protein